MSNELRDSGEVRFHGVNINQLLFKKKESNVNRGNVGFRPTINWRDITLKKRKIADLQLLTCILVAGIGLFALGILFLILGLFVIQTACAVDWEPFQDGCVYLSSHNNTWEQARGFCQGLLGSHMLELGTSERNEAFGSLANGKSYWMGLRIAPSSASRDFEWLSGQALEFENFGGGTRFPNTRSTRKPVIDCVLVDETGRWIVDGACSRQILAACEYSKSYNPLTLIGPLLSITGVAILFLSIEVYQRHRHNQNKGAHLMNDKNPLIKKKVDVEAPLATLPEPAGPPPPGKLAISPSAGTEDLPSRKKKRSPPKPPVKRTDSRKSLKRPNKVGAAEDEKGAANLQELEEDSIKITRSHQSSAEAEDMELVLTPMHL